MLLLPPLPLAAGGLHSYADPSSQLDGNWDMGERETEQWHHFQQQDSFPRTWLITYGTGRLRDFFQIQVCVYMDKVYCELELLIHTNYAS